MKASTAILTIRPAYPDDDPAIRRLAALDSAAVPRGPFLLAETGGELRAALSLSDGRAIADPFHLTVQVVATLRAYAAIPVSEERPRASGGTYRPRRLALKY